MVGIPPESLCNPCLYFIDQFAIIGVCVEDSKFQPIQGPGLPELRARAQHVLDELKSHAARENSLKASQRIFELTCLIHFFSGSCYCPCEFEEKLSNQEILDFYYRDKSGTSAQTQDTGGAAETPMPTDVLSLLVTGGDTNLRIQQLASCDGTVEAARNAREAKNLPRKMRLKRLIEEDRVKDQERMANREQIRREMREKREQKRVRKLKGIANSDSESELSFDDDDFLI